MTSTHRTVSRRRAGLGATMLAAGLLLTAGAEACVAVNGQWLSPADVRAIEYQYGIAVGCGSYWFDAASGYWGRMYGLMMGPPEGRLVAGGGGGGGAGGGYGGAIDRGYGGTWGSDGTCSYVDTGNGYVMSPGC